MWLTIQALRGASIRGVPRHPMRRAARPAATRARCAAAYVGCATAPGATAPGAFRPNEYCMSIIDISEVKPGSHVTLHYRLSLADGAEIVNTFADKPATLLLGAGQLAPPLEDILLGLKVGHHSTFRL